MSDQHPRAKMMGITPGEWTKNKSGIALSNPHIRTVIAQGGGAVCGLWEANQKRRMADIALCAQAGNVANRTGYTPQEMAGLLRECLDIVAEKYDNLSTHEAYKYGDYYRDLLKKLEAFKND